VSSLDHRAQVTPRARADPNTFTRCRGVLIPFLPPPLAAENALWRSALYKGHEGESPVKVPSGLQSLSETAPCRYSDRLMRRPRLVSLTNIWFWMVIVIVLLLVSYFLWHGARPSQGCITFQRKVPLCHY